MRTIKEDHDKLAKKKSSQLCTEEVVGYIVQ